MELHEILDRVENPESFLEFAKALLENRVADIREAQPDLSDRTARGWLTLVWKVFWNPPSPGLKLLTPSLGALPEQIRGRSLQHSCTAGKSMSEYNHPLEPTRYPRVAQRGRYASSVSSNSKSGRSV
jgi:hypothetical protein